MQHRYPPDGPAARRPLQKAATTPHLHPPGIPPVHRVGALPGGRPFLAMKLFFFQAEDGIRRHCVTGVQTCALPISTRLAWSHAGHLPEIGRWPALLMVG